MTGATSASEHHDRDDHSSPLHAEPRLRTSEQWRRTLRRRRKRTLRTERHTIPHCGQLHVVEAAAKPDSDERARSRRHDDSIGARAPGVSTDDGTTSRRPSDNVNVTSPCRGAKKSPPLPGCSATAVPKTFGYRGRTASLPCAALFPHELDANATSTAAIANVTSRRRLELTTGLTLRPRLKFPDTLARELGGAARYA